MTLPSRNTLMSNKRMNQTPICEDMSCSFVDRLASTNCGSGIMKSSTNRGISSTRNATAPVSANTKPYSVTR